MKNYKLKQFFENLLLISIVLIVIYFIISFIISAFSIKKFALPSFSMPKFDYNITIPKINTDFLLNKFKENNITIKENNISKNNNATKTIINDNDININVKTFEITKSIENNDTNNSIKSDLNTTNINDNNKSINNIIVDSNRTITEQNTTIINVTKEIEPVKKDELEEYIDLSILNINKHKNKVRFSQEEETYIKIKFKVLKTGKFKRLIYLSGNKDLIGEARIAIKRSFPNKPNKNIKSKFPRYITTTLQYDNK